MIVIKTNINRIDISYITKGSGNPIILLHGWGANKFTFNTLYNNLSERFLVYSIDLPGFGDTNIGLPFNLYEVADIIHEFCNRFNIDNPIIIGHSYGGRIGIIYAAKYKVRKLILVSSAGIRQPLSIKKKANIKIYKLLKKFNFKPRMGSRDYISSDNVKKRMLVDAVNTDLKEEMNNISSEVLLIYGEKDKTTPLDLANKINGNIKNSGLVIMNDCGHFPFLDKPYEFQLIIDSFLAGDII